MKTNAHFFLGLALAALTGASPLGAQNPTITIHATDSQAGEPFSDTGTFTVRRTGGTNFSVLVFYELSGTASNGVDYQQLGGTVEIPAGGSSASFTITPIDDNLIEGTEIALAQVMPSPLQCPTCGYDIGTPNAAEVFIEDNDRDGTNQPPVLNFYQPQDGQVFTAPADIRLQAFAQDREDRYHVKVEFFEGERSLGFGTFQPALCPAPYCPYYLLTWSTVPPGVYELRAKATDSAGATTVSEAVRVTVIESNRPPVILEHPANYYSLDCRPVTFSVVASGNNLEYQWFRDNQAINNANGPSYTLAHARYPVDDGAVFYVIVANSGGAVTSSNAVLTVSQDPISVWVNCAAASNDMLTVFVEFSTVVTNASDPVNYTIFPGNGGDPLQIESARYATGGSLGSNVVLRLDAATPMASGTAYRLRVDAVLDECGNYISADGTWEIVEPLRLEIASSVAGTTLTWRGEAVLQTAANLSGGAWQTVANARSPYGPLSLDGQQFFRLRACR